MKLIEEWLMIKIAADVFSGRPNPVWLVDDDSESRAALAALASDRHLIIPEAPPEAGLGFRGFRIELLDDDISHRFDLPSTFYLSLEQLSRQAKGYELFERFIALLKRGHLTDVDQAGGEGFNESIQKYLLEQFAQAVSGSVRDGIVEPSTPIVRADMAPQPITCFIELWAFNPGFWNNDATTRLNNNCYNYASNWRTNTFAQPGRGSGHIYPAITCPAVSTAALSDGMHHRFDCFPDNEKPRFLVAMVVSPGPGFVDYHWYRKHQGGFWGHKPGGTAARNFDESHNLITDPQTCNRGPYTQFCGYFYGCNSQRHRIR
jgi:hypothetical protein